MVPESGRSEGGRGEGGRVERSWLKHLKRNVSSNTDVRLSIFSFAIICCLCCCCCCCCCCCFVFFCSSFDRSFTFCIFYRAKAEKKRPCWNIRTWLLTEEPGRVLSIDASVKCVGPVTNRWWLIQTYWWLKCDLFCFVLFFQIFFFLPACWFVGFVKKKICCSSEFIFCSV